MPVIDLNDYLGMPQQAPAQPVFRATTQNVDPMALRADNPYSSDAFLANVEARQRLAGLQRLAPVLQAQQAQLAYDKVAEDARLLRQKQEIEAQVQRATDEITQGAIDPESDQFNEQALQFYGRNQLAFLDPRMKEAMSFLSNQNQQYEAARRARAEAEIKTQEDTRRRYLSALEGGELMPQEIPAGATQEQLAFLQGRAKRRKEETELERKQREAAEQDRKSAMAWAGKRGVPTDLVNLMPDSSSIYQLGSAYGGARGTSATGGPVIKFYENKLQALKARADALSAKADETDDDKARETLLKQASDASQQFIDTNAEFIKTLDELNATGGGAAAGAAPAFTLPNYPYSPEFRAGFEAAVGRFPAAVGGQFTAPGLAPAPAGGAAAGKSVVQQPASFQDAMKKVQPDIGRILKVDQSEVMKDLDDPAADENTFMMAIEDPNTSFEVKKRAAEKLRQIAEKPKKILGLGIDESTARKGRLIQMAENAEKQVRMYPEVEKFRKAWTEEKGKIDKWINEYADSMGYDVDELKVSLADSKPIKSGFSQQEQRETYRDRFEQFIKNKHGDVLSKPAEKLQPFLKSEFREELGMGAVPLSTLGSFVIGLLAPGKGQGIQTYGDVLDAYLKEVKKPVAADAAQANVTTTPKIEIGQPRKVQ